MLLVTTLLCSLGQATAAASLKLGAVLPDWSEVHGGNLHGAASRLVSDYSAQLRHFCVQPEVFLLASAGSIQGARSAYDAQLPAASRQRVLVDTTDQRVTMIITPSGQEVMAILAVTSSGVVLIVC